MSLHRLIEGTEVDESEEVYVTKLALSIGRSTSIHSCGTFIMLTFACAAIIRPKVETELSIQDRHPTCKWDVIPPMTLC